jgi:hypothetical protein
MAELIGGPIGAEAKYSLALEDQKLIIAVQYDGVEADAELKVKLEVGLFIDKLKDLIPGKLDDALFELLKGALK